jgi:hypothetical protein
LPWTGLHRKAVLLTSQVLAVLAASGLMAGTPVWAGAAEVKSTSTRAVGERVARTLRWQQVEQAQAAQRDLMPEQVQSTHLALTSSTHH